MSLELIDSILISKYDPASNVPSGVTYDKVSNTLWICDASNKKIYNIKLDGILIISYLATIIDGSITNPNSIEYDETTDTLWLGDAVLKKLFNFTKSGVLIDSFVPTASPIPIPYGIAVVEDGTLWICDRSATDRILHIKRTGGFLSSFNTSIYDLLANSPTGITYQMDGGYLWICDTNTKKVYKVEKDGTLVDYHLLTDDDPGYTVPNGVGIGAESIWVAESNSDSILRYLNITEQQIDTIKIIGYIYKETGEPEVGSKVKIYPEKVTDFNNIKLLKNIENIETDDKGAWIVDLIPSENIGEVKYVFEFLDENNKKKIVTKNVRQVGNDPYFVDFDEL